MGKSLIKEIALFKYRITQGIKVISSDCDLISELDKIMRLLVKMFLIISLLFIFLSSNVFADSNNSQSKSESRNQGINSENWKNHRYSFNPLYTRYREGKSNNEPFFSEPNNDQLSIDLNEILNFYKKFYKILVN